MKQITIFLAVFIIWMAYGSAKSSRSSHSHSKIHDYLNKIGFLSRKRKPFEYHKKFFSNPKNSHFNYNPKRIRGPTSWKKSFIGCGGSRQSPVDLKAEYCKPRTEKKPLMILRDEAYPDSILMENNGYSVEFLFEFSNGRPVLTGGPLKSTYIFEEMHLHWSMESGEGSEHAIETMKGDVEMHLLHLNSKYSDFHIASEYKDGIAVIGVLFRESECADDLPILKDLKKVVKEHTSWEMDISSGRFRLKDILGPMKNYFSYQGSTTTPPCAEATSWIVDTTIRYISPKDMANLRILLGKDNKPMAPNFRPLQKFNNRECFIYN